MPGPYWCKRLTTRAWKNRLYRLPLKKDYHVYIARSSYHYAYARRTQVNWKKETKKRKKDKGNERKKRQKSEKTKKEGKAKKDKKNKKRQDKKRKQGKENREKMSY